MYDYNIVFHKLVQGTQTDTGYTLPDDIAHYLSMLLANYIDNPGFLPKVSFAESYSKLSHRDVLSAKELGDVCLFLSGVFPEYGERWGLNKTYYKSIGSSSYDIASRSLNHRLFYVLATEFDFVSGFLTCVTRNNDIRIRIT